MTTQSIASAPLAASTAGAPRSPTDPLANKNVFLQLLVAQLKYQDPESPADGTQFVTQLAQFSQLEDSGQMMNDLDAIRQALAPSPSPVPST